MSLPCCWPSTDVTSPVPEQATAATAMTAMTNRRAEDANRGLTGVTIPGESRFWIASMRPVS